MNRKILTSGGLILAGAVLALGITIPLLNITGKRGQPVSIEVTRSVPQTVVVTQVVERVITATPEPTLAIPTSTPLPSPTATPDTLGLVDNGFTAWCIPYDIFYSADALTQTGQMPEGARPGSRKDDGTMALDIQVQSCTLMFTFNREVPAGTRLQVQDLNPQPFIDVEMTHVTEHSNMVFTTVNHPYIVDPPFWSITYEIRVVDPSGAALWSEPVAFKRSWVAGYCYHGEMPDPVTFQCIGYGEAHPWDPWFGMEYPLQNTTP
jgi:hypothetical protein